jgi:hypothetical protein
MNAFQFGQLVKQALDEQQAITPEQAGYAEHVPENYLDISPTYRSYVDSGKLPNSLMQTNAGNDMERANYTQSFVNGIGGINNANIRRNPNGVRSASASHTPLARRPKRAQQPAGSAVRQSAAHSCPARAPSRHRHGRANALEAHSAAGSTRAAS